MEVSFSADFVAKKGEWLEVKIPFTDFKGNFRGTDLPKQKLDPSMIRRVGILLSDKTQAPFDIEIDHIRTYGKGQGKFTEREKEAAAEKPVVAERGTSRLIETAVADGRFTTFKKALDAARVELVVRVQHGDLLVERHLLEERAYSFVEVIRSVGCSGGSHRDQAEHRRQQFHFRHGLTPYPPLPI